MHVHLKYSLYTIQLQEWKTLLVASYPCQAFTVRFMNKLSESLIAMKVPRYFTTDNVVHTLQALSLALQSNTNDSWDRSNTCVRLLQKLVPLPGRLECRQYS